MDDPTKKVEEEVIETPAAPEAPAAPATPPAEEPEETIVETPAAPDPEDPIAARDAKIKKLEIERDNYRKVALKRLGKLPNDAEFIAGGDTILTVEDQVKLALMNEEIQKVIGEKDKVARDLVKENKELRLALKNRPGASQSGGSGDSLEVKDNILSDAQIKTLTARATRLGVDPKGYIDNFKKNLAGRR